MYPSNRAYYSFILINKNMNMCLELKKISSSKSMKKEFTAQNQQYLTHQQIECQLELLEHRNKVGSLVLILS